MILTLVFTLQCIIQLVFSVILTNLYHLLISILITNISQQLNKSNFLISLEVQMSQQSFEASNYIFHTLFQHFPLFSLFLIFTLPLQNQFHLITFPYLTLLFKPSIVVHLIYLDFLFYLLFLQNHTLTTKPFTLTLKILSIFHLCQIFNSQLDYSPLHSYLELIQMLMMDKDFRINKDLGYCYYYYLIVLGISKIKNRFKYLLFRVFQEYNTIHCC